MQVSIVSQTLALDLNLLLVTIKGISAIAKKFSSFKEEKRKFLMHTQGKKVNLTLMPFHRIRVYKRMQFKVPLFRAAIFRAEIFKE
jgi:hypothetical protein